MNIVDYIQQEARPGGRFAAGAYELALHAAFPVAVTVDMMYQLWANFYAYADARNFPMQMERLAVSDLLLSPIWRPVGGRVYEPDMDVRAELLDRLRRDARFGEGRLRQLAMFTKQYAETCVRAPEQASLRETLLWNAEATLAPAKALDALRSRMTEQMAANKTPEMLRIRDLAELFATQEKSPDEKMASSFGQLLEYSVALKAGFHQMPDMVQTRLGQTDFVISEHKPANVAAFPFPKKMLDERAADAHNQDKLRDIQTVRLLILANSKDAEAPERTSAIYERDAQKVEAAFRTFFEGQRGVQLLTTILKGESATLSAVMYQFVEGGVLQPGDTFVMVYCGDTSAQPIQQQSYGNVAYQQQSNVGSFGYQEASETPPPPFVRLFDTNQNPETQLTAQKIAEWTTHQPSINYVLMGLPSEWAQREHVLANTLVLTNRSEFETAFDMVARDDVGGTEQEVEYTAFSYFLSVILSEARPELTYGDLKDKLIELLQTQSFRQYPQLVAQAPTDRKQVFRAPIAYGTSELYYALALHDLQHNDPKGAIQNLDNSQNPAMGAQDGLVMQLLRRLYNVAGSAASQQLKRATAWKFTHEETRTEALNLVRARLADLHSRPDESTYTVTFLGSGLPEVTIMPPPVGFIRVEGDDFLMGDVFENGHFYSLPVRNVEVRDFEIGRFAVTFDEFDVFCEAEGHDKPTDENWGRGRRPVINVTWLEAAAYCNWRSRMEGLIEVYDLRNDSLSIQKWANGYRLPFEREWEFAARERGRKVKFGNGQKEAKAADMNFKTEQTTTVGSYRPNALGLYDMCGNVFEWCWDDYIPYSRIDSDAAPAFHSDTNASKIIRGVSWRVEAGQYNVFSRPYYHTETRHTDVGFRIVRQVPTEEKPDEDETSKATQTKPRDYTDARQQAREYIGQAKIEEAIKILLEAYKDNDDSQNQLILLSSRFQKLQKDNRLGTISHSQLTMESNKLVSALLEFIQDAEQDDDERDYPKKPAPKTPKKK